jgi:hypothetical protein
MSEAESFRKRRTFSWSKEARGLVRDYKARGGSILGHNEPALANADHQAD